MTKKFVLRWGLDHNGKTYEPGTEVFECEDFTASQIDLLVSSGIAEPVELPSSKLIAEPAPEIVVGLAPESVVGSAPEIVVGLAPESVVGSAPEIVAEPVPKSAIEPTPEAAKSRRAKKP